MIAIGWLPNERLVGERLAAAAVPVPERPRDWGLPPALSVMLTEAERLPLVVGSKVTLIVQLPPAATELPQVLVSAKSPGLAPASAMLETLSAAVPLLVRVAVSVPLVVLTASLPKARLVGERPAATVVPVPERLRDWGLPVALSVMLTEAERLPLVVGSKVTLIVQLPPAATELPQVLVSAKSPGLAPASAMLETLSAAVPLLVRVAVSVPLVVLTASLPKARLVGERPAATVVPVPERLRDWGLPVALSVMLTEAERLPLVVGSKVTLIVQLPPAATELPQVLVSAKSPGLAPASAMLETLSAAVPLLVRVAVSVPLVVLTASLPKARLVGERPAATVVPVPERLRDWGLPVALSVMLTEAERLPLVVGSKETLIVQLPPAATELPQVLVSAKSPVLAPVSAMPERLSAALPLLVRVAVSVPLLVLTGSLPKERLAGDRLAAATVPVPERLIVWGLPAVALSEMLTEAVRLPLAVGSKVTLIVQLPPAATELPQVLVSAKSPALAPVTAMLETLNAALPLLARVAVSVPLAVPTGWFPKERLLAETLADGSAAATPVPLRLTLSRPPRALVEMLSVAERCPVVLGVKVNLTAQLAPTASEKPQLLDCENLLAYVPLIPTPLMKRVPPPVFCKVTFCTGLVVLTGTDPNETLVADLPDTSTARLADNAIVLEAERIANAVIVARRIPAFRRA